MRKYACLILFLILSLSGWSAGNIEVQTVPAGARIYLQYLDDGGIKAPDGQDSLKTQDPRFQNGLAYAGNAPLRIDMIGVGKFRASFKL